MQCPNCQADTTAALPRCTRCNALLPLPSQRPPGQVEGSDVLDADARRQRDTWAPWDSEHEAAGPVVAEPPPAVPTSAAPTSAVPRGGQALLVVAIALVVAGGGLAAGVAFWPRDDHPPGPSQSFVPAPPVPASTSDVSPSGEPAPSGSEPVAHDQAIAIDGLLEEMASSRTKLGGAMSDASRCDGLTAAVDALSQVRDERQEQLDKARTLAVDALDGGTALRQALVGAAESSLRADDEFLAWAEANEGCTEADTPKDGHFDRGQQISIDEAGPAKREFVDQWNPVAELEGLSPRSADDF